MTAQVIYDALYSSTTREKLIHSARQQFGEEAGIIILMSLHLLVSAWLRDKNTAPGSTLALPKEAMRGLVFEVLSGDEVLGNFFVSTGEGIAIRADVSSDVVSELRTILLEDVKSWRKITGTTTLPESTILPEDERQWTTKPVPVRDMSKSWRIKTRKRGTHKKNIIPDT